MDTTPTSAGRSPREKLVAFTGEIKSRSLEKASEARVAVASIKPRLNALSERAGLNLRANPSKWTGIATGAGLGLGLLGRFLHHRSRYRLRPALIIVDAGD